MHEYLKIYYTTQYECFSFMTLSLVLICRWTLFGFLRDFAHWTVNLAAETVGLLVLQPPEASCMLPTCATLLPASPLAPLRIRPTDWCCWAAATGGMVLDGVEGAGVTEQDS